MSCLIEMYRAVAEDNAYNFELTEKWNSDNDSPICSIPLGYCDVGETVLSDFLFWYNRKGSKRIGNLFGVKISISGNTSGSDIFNHINFLCSFCVDGEWTDFQSFNDGVLIRAASSSMPQGVLSGAANAGMHSNKRNYSKIRLKAIVNPNSRAGSLDFVIKISVHNPKEVAA